MTSQNLSLEMKQLIQGLLKELSTEIDLHYEDTQIGHLFPMISYLQTGKKLLEAAGAEVPEVTDHVLRCFNRNIN